MDNKGQTLELLGILFIVGIVVVGTTAVFLHRDSAFMGDSATKELYSYSKCMGVINQIPSNNLVVYDSLEKAQSDGFNLKGCE